MSSIRKKREGATAWLGWMPSLYPWKWDSLSQWNAYSIVLVNNKTWFQKKGANDFSVDNHYEHLFWYEGTFILTVIFWKSI